MAEPPGRTEPLEEEYSRCLDPGRYLILRARAQAWSSALVGLGLAVPHEADAAATPWRGETPPLPPDRVLWVRPLKPRTVPLLLAFQPLQGVPEAVVSVGAGEPAALVLTVPDCGCDACDDGSQPLLDQLDASVLAVADGTLVHVSTGHGSVVAAASGWSAGGDLARGDVEALLADARAGRSRHRVVRGDPWW